VVVAGVVVGVVVLLLPIAGALMLATKGRRVLEDAVAVDVVVIDFWDSLVDEAHLATLADRDESVTATLPWPMTEVVVEQSMLARQEHLALL